MVDRKKISKRDIIGQRGVNLIEGRVLEMGFLWHPTGLEAGIDGYIELRDPATEQVLNSILLVQSKATDEPFDSNVEFTCEQRDLDYWLQGNTPIIFVRSCPRTGEAFWVELKTYFRDPLVRQHRKIRFDRKEDRFDSSCAHRLLHVSASRDAGLYFTPPPAPEEVYTNLLRVDATASQVYSAATEHRFNGELAEALREIGIRAQEWFLKRGRVYTFHDLRQEAWAHVCDPDTIDVVTTEEWLAGENEERIREYTWLLNEALRAKTRPLGLGYNRRIGCFFFRATRDLSPRYHSYSSIVRTTARAVFQGYPKRGDVRYYRHSAFEGRFERIDGTWYLAVTPTYYFTSDGHAPHKFCEDKLKGAKAPERNAAVFGQVVMWCDLLCGGRKQLRIEEPYPFLKFGTLMPLTIETSIEDDAWLSGEEDSEQTDAAASRAELPQFAQEVT